MNKIKGCKGEVIAKKYLIKQGLKVIKVNYCNKIGEIDIIAIDKQGKKETTVFCEVKYRTTAMFGLPREAVNAYKQQKIRMVATGYLQKENKLDTPVRFDVIDILNDEISHIKNAF